MVCRETDAQRLEQPLQNANRQLWATNMFEQQDLPSGSEYAPGLGDRAAWVGDRAEAKRADDGVKTVVRELERLGISEAQIGRVRELCCTPASDREHLRAQLDTGEHYITGIVPEIAGGADCELEHTAMCLFAHPLATIGKEDPLEERDLTVVMSRVPVL